jgi:hypothetical protein
MVDPIVTDAKSEWSKVITWVKGVWLHIPTWVGLVAVLLGKHL